jgi:adenylate cyclase
VADIVGYSAVMERYEPGTLARVMALRDQLIEPAIGAARGRVVKTTGDGVLAEFRSVVYPVEAAIAIQEGLAGWPDVGAPLQLRIGIHSGVVMVRDGDIFGDGVNIAARLEQAAEPGGILISSVDRRDAHPVR